ncbi:hypothetical protein R3I93_021144 [Phoxinus phoxinus]|uniref:Uncharacterized protein n=1 Tax=Phoxinus phoxinus TaxID=58324 RepID=A0AAN9C7M2_9TELE
MIVREIVHDGEGEGLYHVERIFVARSMSCELHSSISSHQSRIEGLEETFSASSADLRFTIHDGGGRAAGDVLRNFHKGIKPGEQWFRVRSWAQFVAGSG